MKLSQILLLAGMLCVASVSYAKTTPIVFAKGSTCGMYDGNVAGEIFTLQLNKGQILYIDVDSSKPITPKVSSPQGKSIPIDYEYPDGVLAYRTTTKGKYSVRFDVADNNYPFAEVEFCAE